MKKSKGFTMVELLAAIAILGLLTVMSFPTMRALQSRNDQKKYVEYGRSMISAAKLYTDSYAEDLFPRGYKNEFAIISTEDLAKKDLLKKIGLTDVSCINSESFIAVAKYGDDYQYCLSVKCKNKSGNVVYEETNKEGICKTYDTIKVIYEYDPGGGLPKRTHPDPIIKGDDTYYAQNPSKFGNFDFSANHQVFEGWVKQGTTERIGIGDKINPSDLKSNLTLTADFRPYKYKVEYSANGGTGSVTEHWCNYGANCTLRANGYSKIGSTYLNWKDGKENTYPASSVQKNLVETDGGSITLSANWRLNKIYILYNANGASLQSPYLKDFTIKNNLIYKNNDSKFFSASYGQKLTTDGLVDYNNTKYINIAKSGSKMQSGQEWNTASNGTGTSYNQNTQYEASTFCDASNGDCTKTLYANWKPNDLKVTFDCNGGTGGGTQTFVYGTANQAFNKTCKMTGYTMTGWNTKKDGSGTNYSTTYAVTNDLITNNSPEMTLYAKWRKNKVTVTYMANGGTMADPHNSALTIVNDMVHKNGTVPIHTVEHGGTVNLCNYDYSVYLNITKAGHTVTAGQEWNTKADGTGTSYDQTKDYTTAEFCDTSNGDCNKTIYVNWKPKTYRVKVEKGDNIKSVSLDGSTSTLSKRVKYGSTVKINATAADFYHFVKWSDGSTTKNRTVKVTGNLTLKATAAKNRITIVYNADGGKLKCSSNNKSCKKTACNSGKDHPDIGCTGSLTGEVARYDYNFDNEEMKDYGLFDHKEKNTSLLMTKSDSEATYYWHVGSSNSSKKISEKTRFKTIKEFAITAGYEASIKTNANTVITLYAGWE